MIDVGRGVVFGPGSTISGRARYLAIPEIMPPARERVRRHLDVTGAPPFWDQYRLY